MIKETMDFGDIMKYWRKINKYTVEDAMKIFGSSYCNWEHRRNMPRKTRLADIAQKTNLKLTDLTEAYERSEFKANHKKDPYKFNIKNPEVAKVLVEKKEEENKQIAVDNAENFDKLTLQYAEKLKEKETLMKDWLDIKDKIEAIKTELETLKTRIRSVA